MFIKTKKSYSTVAPEWIQVFFYIIISGTLIVASVRKNIFVSYFRDITLTIIKPVAYIVELPFSTVEFCIEVSKKIFLTNMKNKKLMEENARLKDLYNKSLIIGEENLILKKMLKLEKQYDETQHKIIHAKTYLTGEHKIIVNVGKKDGVVDNSAVLNHNNELIGKITNADEYHSEVALLSNVLSVINVKTLKTREKLLARGNRDNFLITIAFASQEPVIVENDIVFTSDESVNMVGDIFVGNIVVKDKDIFIKTKYRQSDIDNVIIIVK
jgi:cell shape-determining protein MreC